MVSGRAQSTDMFLALTILALSTTTSLATMEPPSWTQVGSLPSFILPVKCVVCQAVNHYVRSMSWTKLLINLIDPNLNDVMEETKLKRLQQGPLSLQSDADWVEALEKSLLRQR